MTEPRTDHPAIQLTILTPSEIGEFEQELQSAWNAYQKMTEKHGLELGRVCHELRVKFKAQGKKGQGLRPILDKVGIPRSTAYWWMERYEINAGLREAKDQVRTEDEIADQKEINDAKREEERLWAETYSKEYALRRTAGDKDFDAGEAAEKAADAAAPDADESKKLEAREAARKARRAKQNAIEDNVPATCPDCHRTFLTQTNFYEHDCPEQKERDSLDETPVFNNTDNTVDAPDAVPAAQDGPRGPSMNATFTTRFITATLA